MGQKMKWMNRIVLAWGYASLIGIVVVFLWQWISYRKMIYQTELVPSFVHLTDLAKNPDFNSYTASVSRIGAVNTQFTDKTLIASYFFKNKYSKRRMEEWREIENFIRNNKGQLSEADITSLLGPPDSIEETKRHLHYDLVNFGGGSMGAEIDIADGKAVETHETSWIH